MWRRRNPHTAHQQGISAVTTRSTHPAPRWIEANPAAIPLAAGAVFPVARSLLGCATGRWINAELTWTPTIKTVLCVLIVALWLNQQLNAPLLLTRA